MLIWGIIISNHQVGARVTLTNTSTVNSVPNESDYAIIARISFRRWEEILICYHRLLREKSSWWHIVNCVELFHLLRARIEFAFHFVVMCEKIKSLQRSFKKCSKNIEKSNEIKGFLLISVLIELIVQRKGISWNVLSQ